MAPSERRRIELEELEQFLDPCGDAAAIPAEQRRHGGDVLRHGAMREEAMVLDHVADAPAQFMDGQPGGVLAVDQDAAGGRLDEPIDHAHQCRLAGAGGADDDGEGAALDHHADIVDRNLRTVGLGEPFDRDHGRAPVTSSIVASRTMAAAKARRTVGRAPSRMRSGAVWPRPAKTNTPKPPPPIRAAMVAIPIF